ncbi:hypothetical protein F2Q70_00022668 [Brassica cretica]|uniref:BED-type domain-containing protein n=2 Tax=Brassica cretica TaxID=69181 RepID=A0A3N6PWT0_BRACR|nr:hypothetical protein F2Q70_00022668 [Brassica cretica]KAF2559814.1 hypothetical protein F2Q68_00016894 [Brassica cretica]KAF3607595.1 hypothetical protein DY000_02049339 [Brassica cretica]
MSACEDNINDDQLGEGHESMGTQAGSQNRSVAALYLREDDPSIANCRYCGQDIRCESKKSGTSAMKNHITRLFNENLALIPTDLAEASRDRIRSVDSKNTRKLEFVNTLHNA